MLTDQVAVTLLVTDALEALGVPYAVAGSLAGAVHGVVRATMDTGVVADLGPEQADALAGALGGAFYADVEMMRDAVRGGGSFNLIHLETMFKVDVFVAGRRPFDRAQLERRQAHSLGEDPERHLYVTSAEDVVLAKLAWYRSGGEVSERQWRDVIGVLRVQGERLDRDYTARMAADLGVSDLLERALGEAG